MGTEWVKVVKHDDKAVITRFKNNSFAVEEVKKGYDSTNLALAQLFHEGFELVNIGGGQFGVYEYWLRRD